VKSSITEATHAIAAVSPPSLLCEPLLYAAGRFLPIKVRAFLDVAAARLKMQLARG